MTRRGLSQKIRDAERKHTNTDRHGRARERPWLHQIDIDDFLEVMQVNNVSRATSDELLFSCPFPGHSSGDSRPSAYMNDGSKDQTKATVWKCHGCNRAGNAISFYAEIENVSKQEAARQLKEEYAAGFREPPEGGITKELANFFRKREREREETRQEHELPQIPWDTYDERYYVDWADAYMEWEGKARKPGTLTGYLFDRGFQPETLMDWKIGYDERSERFTIPVCDPQGNLVGIKARTWKPKREEKIKYLILGDNPARKGGYKYGWKHYEKSHVLFGLEHVPEGTEEVVLVEGELDVIALNQIGIPAVCTGGASISEDQARLLRQYADRLVIFYDSNTAGWEGTTEVLMLTEPFMRVSVVDEDHEQDAADFIAADDESGLHELLSTATPSHQLFI